MSSIILVNIIAPESLKLSIIEDINANGAKSYTAYLVEGKGSYYEHITDWEGKNIKIETLVHENIANKIMEEIKNKYFNKFGVIVYSHPVNVIRQEKFMNSK
jgi:nitrogen regulatory protein P-II 2